MNTVLSIEKYSRYLIKSGVKKRKEEYGQITVVSNSNAKALHGTEYFEQNACSVGLHQT